MGLDERERDFFGTLALEQVALQNSRRMQWHEAGPQGLESSARREAPALERTSHAVRGEAQGKPQEQGKEARGGQAGLETSGPGPEEPREIWGAPAEAGANF